MPAKFEVVTQVQIVPNSDGWIASPINTNETNIWNLHRQEELTLTAPSGHSITLKVVGGYAEL